MSVPLSLSYITIPELSPPEALAVAAETGCRHISVRLMSGVPGGDLFPIMTDAALRRETARVSRALGVTALDVEVARLQADTDVSAFAPFLEVAAELGARHVLVTGDDADEARLTACYAAFCDAASGYGLTADLEYMPWLSVRDLATALRIVRGAGRGNAGILVDALHHDRAGGVAGDVAGVPPDRLHYMQICDAGAERPTDVAAMIHTARDERMLPGEGALALVPLLRALPRDIVVSLEIPMATLAREVSARERARRAVAATRRVLAEAWGESAV